MCQTHQGELFFRNGNKYPGEYRKYMMEHAGSRGKITAGEMWEFLSVFITHNDMGMIARYIKPNKSGKPKTISRRLKGLISRTRKQMSHILVDVPARWRHVDERIARELSHMARIKLLDLDAYMDTVHKKKIRKPAPAPLGGRTLKQVERSRKRKLCKALKRNDSLRFKVKTQAKTIKEQAKHIKLQAAEIARQASDIRTLKETIKELQQGSHDLTLDGPSQVHMEQILRQCVADPSLGMKIRSQDNSGVLKMFWEEQVTEYIERIAMYVCVLID